MDLLHAARARDEAEISPEGAVAVLRLCATYLSSQPGMPFSYDEALDLVTRAVLKLSSLDP